MIGKLKPGQRFSFIPAAWHGPAIVREVYGNMSGWTLKFDNDRIVNPPGVYYCDGTEQVRILRRNARSQGGK